jgi:hypothetical protein
MAGERTWRPSTHRSYELAVAPARAAFGRTRLQHLERADVERLVTTMLRAGGREGAGRSPRTVALLLTILGKAFKDAQRDDLIARNPVEHVRKSTQQHHEMAITQRTYAHVTATALDAASGVFDQVLGTGAR